MANVTVDVDRVLGGRVDRLQAAGNYPQQIQKILMGLGPSVITDVLPLAQDDKWAQVAQEVTDAKAAMKQTTAQLAEISEAVEQLFPLSEVMVTGRPVVGISADDVQRIKDALADRGLDPALVRRALQSGTRPLDQTVTFAAQMLTAGWQQALRRDAQLNHALAVGQFNLAATQQDGDDAAVEVVEAAGERIDDAVRAGLVQVAKQLQKRDYAYAARAASSNVQIASQMLAEIAVPLAAQTARVEDAPAALAAADTLRRLLWFTAAMKDLAWRCLWPTSAAGGLADAAALSTYAKAPKLRRPSIKRLVAGSVDPGDALIELTGTVNSLEITHEVRGKAVTRIELTADDQTPFTTRVHGFKADSTGLVPGTYAALCGTWRAGDDETPSHLVIGRDSITSDRMNSFEQYLRWLSAPIYLPVPHGLLIRTSWISGAEGPLNPVRYGVSARES